MRTVDGKVKSGDLEVTGLKPGMYTTEFWLVLAAMVCATALSMFDKIDSNHLLQFGQWIIGAYIGGRSIAKSGMIGSLLNKK